MDQLNKYANKDLFDCNSKLQLYNKSAQVNMILWLCKRIFQWITHIFFNVMNELFAISYSHSIEMTLNGNRMESMLNIEV